MVIIGGPGSIPGVILGAFILVLLPEMLREIQLYRMLALGAGLVLLMVFRPQGLFGGRGVSFRS
jgi:branched-chain amino acid transport system permease protein